MRVKLSFIVLISASIGFFNVSVAADADYALRLEKAAAIKSCQSSDSKWLRIIEKSNYSSKSTETYRSRLKFWEAELSALTDVAQRDIDSFHQAQVDALEAKRDSISDKEYYDKKIALMFPMNCGKIYSELGGLNDKNIYATVEQERRVIEILAGSLMEQSANKLQVRRCAFDHVSGSLPPGKGKKVKIEHLPKIELNSWIWTDVSLSYSAGNFQQKQSDVSPLSSGECHDLLSKTMSASHEKIAQLFRSPHND